MSTTVFVGNIPGEATAATLRALFEERVGAVRRAWICKDGATGRSRGFGFVDLELSADADRAVRAVNGAEVAGYTLAVARACSGTKRANPRGEGAVRDTANERTALREGAAVRGTTHRSPLRYAAQGATKMKVGS